MRRALALLLVLGACQDQTGGTGPVPPVHGVVAIDLSVATATLLTGEEVQVSAIPKSADGRPVPDRPIAWSSGSPAIVAVQSGGRATALSLGTAEIQASVDGRTASIALSVLPAQPVELVGRWRMRSFEGKTLPAAYAEFHDEPVGDRIVRLVEIRLDSAIMDIEPDGEYARRYLFTEWHDGVMAFRYLWGDHGQMTLGGAEARGQVALVSDYIQHLRADGAVHADRTIRLIEPLWIGEEAQRTVWEPRAPPSVP